MVNKVVTGEVRFAFPYIFEPRAMSEGQEPKYSICPIISKNDVETVNKINRAVEEAIQEGARKYWGGKIPRNLKLPLRDGDEDRSDKPEFAGCYFLNANSKIKPGVVDLNREPIYDQTEIYSGCYGRVSLNFYPFNSSGNKGVAVSLNHVQKLGDGEPLNGRAKAEDDFADELL